MELTDEIIETRDKFIARWAPLSANELVDFIGELNGLIRIAIYGPDPTEEELAEMRESEEQEMMEYEEENVLERMMNDVFGKKLDEDMNNDEARQFADSLGLTVETEEERIERQWAEDDAEQRQDWS
mgnify:CR=1 FL=1